MDTLSLFVNQVRLEQPRANTEGDDKTLWAKRSVPAAARAFYGLWDTATMSGGAIPDEFLVDYWRQEAVMGDLVLAHVIENKIFWRDFELRTSLPEIDLEAMKTRAAEFLSGPAA